MRIQAAPEINNLTFQAWVTRSGVMAFSDLLRTAQAQRGYHPWRKARYTAPDGISPEVWWSTLCLARQLSVIDPTLTGVSGHPFLLSVTDEIRRLLHEVDRKAPIAVTFGGTNGRDDFSNHRRTYLQDARIAEAISSSQMEGAATTRQVAQEMLLSERPPRDEGERMIANNYTTIRNLDTWCREPLSEDLLARIHRTLTDGLLPEAAQGHYRTTDDIIVRNRYDEIVHQPPPAAELPTRMAALIAFANQDAEARDTFLHPVLKAILLHTLLAYEHPFRDGNGRTARALFYWSLLRDGYWIAPYVSISRMLRQERAAYDEAYLDMETCHLDTTYCVLVNLRVFVHGLRNLHAYIEDKKAQTLRWRETLQGQFNARQLDLLDHTLRHPDYHYTFQEHQNWHAISHNTARADLEDLESRGFLKRHKLGRLRYYTVTDLFKTLVAHLLHEDRDAPLKRPAD